MVGAAPGMTRVLAAGLALLATTAAAQNYVVEGSCRDGRPHGAYELRSAGGQVLAVGAFNRGRRTGSFLFWSSAGARIAQLPYDDDTLSGTLALWFAGTDRRGNPKPRLEAVYEHGRLTGIKQSWHENGQVRAQYRYDHGALIDARAFNAAGKPLPDVDARALAERDGREDVAFFSRLEAMVRDNLPDCEPAGDRLEKG